MFAGSVDKIYMSSALSHPINEFKSSSMNKIKREIPELVIPEFDTGSDSIASKSVEPKQVKAPKIEKLKSGLKVNIPELVVPGIEPGPKRSA